jgi:LemA protein
MSKKTSSIWAILGILGVVVLLGTCRYNSLVTAEQRVDSSWAQVENALQRRADLIPNLVETVKGYASHEREIFTEVAEARGRLLGAQSPGDAAAANAGMSSALGRLLAISERYPDLKANQNFIGLQDELAGSENRIAVERRRYNTAVEHFNTRIRRFPDNLVANVFGFATRTYFEAQQEAKTVPKVNLSSMND